MQLLTLNAAGKSLAPVRNLDPRRRRLSQVIGRHVDRSRPHMIAVQRARDPLQPIDEAWVTRGRDRAGKVKPWPRRYLPADAVVVVVYLPRGGLGGGSSGSRGGKSGLSIALGIAGLALAAFAGPLAGALLPSLVFGSTATFALQAGLVIGGTALLSLASRAKANKQVTDTTQIYGVAGGGNLPKPGDRIPRGYGRSWMKPDLSQPDFSQYDGDEQILLKRHTLGVGKYHPYQVRAGKQVMWREGAGFLAPFDDARNRIEFVYGTASTLVPSNVVSASGVGGTLPRPADNPAVAGPFLINQRGALITRIQVDYQFPGGISSSATKGSGAQVSNLPGFWSVLFEYAPIDDSGAVTGAWAPVYDGSNATEAPLFATHPLRYTKFKDVPAGRYAVRGRNRMPDTTGNQGVKGTAVNVDAVQWDAASGWVDDVAIRPGVTEMALRIYATKGNQAAAFGEIEIDAGAIIPVWTGAAWIEQETSKAVWAYLDIMRDTAYGGAIADDQLDLGTALYYAGALTEFDTFDATLRGPVSVYEAAATALLPMRAEPVHLGRFWSFVRDEPKAVRRHLITRGQMQKGSSQITFDLDTAAGAGHVIGEFDQDGDYRNPNQCTAIYGEASLTPTRQRWTGVKTFAHATHLTRWRGASGAFRRQAAPFGVEMEGRIYKRGDSISVDPWFIDVRKKANVVNGFGDTLVLDADVPLAAGDAIQLRDRDGREWGPLALVGQGASLREIVLSTASRQQVETTTGRLLADVLSDGRRDMTSVLVGALIDLQENYLIQSVKPDGSSKAQVEALIDDPRVWAALGTAIGNPPPGYGGILEPESPAILNLVVNAVQLAAGLRGDFTISPGRGAVTFELDISYDGGSRYSPIYGGPSTTGSVDLNPVDPQTARFRARAFGATGLPGVYFYATLDLPAAVVVADFLGDLSIEIEKLSAQTQKEVSEISDLGKGLLALDQDAGEIGFDLAHDTLRGGMRQLQEAVQRLADAASDRDTNDFLQRDTIRVGNSANFAGIERETIARVTATDALASQYTTLAAQLTSLSGQVTGQASAISGLSASVSSLNGMVTSQGQAITALTSRVTTAESGISGQATATQALTTRVTLAEGSITSTSQALTSLQGSVSTQGGQIAGNGMAITNLTTRVVATESGVSSNAQAITTLQSAVSTQGGQISGSATAISSLTTRANTVDGQISSQATAITALQSTVGGHTATLTTYGSALDGVKVQFGVTGSIDGTTGGFVFTGVKKLDGSVSYTVAIQGSLIVAGSVTAAALNVLTVSSITASLGTITTGKIQSADGKWVTDYTNKYDAFSD